MPRTKPETPDLASYPDDFLKCRTGRLRHRWDEVGAYKEGSLTIYVKRCARCGTVVNQPWDRFYARRRPTYQYAPGYLLPGLRPSPQDVRRETARRIPVYLTEADMVASLGGGRRTRRKAS